MVSNAAAHTDMDTVWHIEPPETAVRWPLTSTVGPGLSGAIAATTAIAGYDRATGRVIYRGRDAAEIATSLDFETAAFFLLTGHLPSPVADDAADDARAAVDFTAFRHAARTARTIPPPVRGMLDQAPTDASALARLRAGLSALGCLDDPPHGTETSTDTALLAAATIIGHAVGIVAHLARRATAPVTPPVTPESVEVSLSATLTAMRATSADEASAPIGAPSLDSVLIAVADDDLEPATFSALVVASCLADPVSAVVAGLSALDGRWSPEKLVALPTAHSRDARIPLLQKQKIIGSTGTADTTDADADAADDGNVDGLAQTAAVALTVLGVEVMVVPAVLALGRLVGMLARIREYRADVRIFRPFARYVERD